MSIWKKTKLAGRVVDISYENGNFYGDWGVVIGYDGEHYHVAFAGDTKNVLVFLRNEFRVRREK